MKNTSAAILIALALSVFIVFWDSPPEAFIKQKKTTVAALPKATSYMTNSTTRKFSESGVEIFTLHTERGQFFQREDVFVMAQPRMQSNSETPDQAPWHMMADEGEIFSRGAHIVLSGNVEAWQVAPAGRTDLKTDQLAYYSETKHVETDRKVTLRSPGSHITGIGLTADLEREVFQLLANVKSKHYGTN